MSTILNHRLSIAFGICQIFGVVCAYFWVALPKETISFSIWIASIVLLFPGDLIGQAIVEKMLWMKGISLESLAWISTLSGIVINGALWFGLRAALSFRNRRKD